MRKYHCRLCVCLSLRLPHAACLFPRHFFPLLLPRLFFLCALSTLLNASKAGGLAAFYILLRVDESELFVCCCLIHFRCGWYLGRFFLHSLHVIFLQHTRKHFLREIKNRKKQNIDKVIYICTSEWEVSVVVPLPPLFLLLLADTTNRQISREIYECEIILGNKHKSFQCVHIFCIILLDFVGRHLTLALFVTSRRKKWKSSTVLLLFLNPLC